MFVSFQELRLAVKPNPAFDPLGSSKPATGNAAVSPHPQQHFEGVSASHASSLEGPYISLYFLEWLHNSRSLRVEHDKTIVQRSMPLLSNRSARLRPLGDLQDISAKSLNSMRPAIAIKRPVFFAIDPGATSRQPPFGARFQTTLRKRESNSTDGIRIPEAFVNRR